VQANPHKLDACFSGCDADLVSRSELLGRSQGRSCELRASGIARRRTEQAGAPLSWTIERAATFFGCERVRKAAAHKRPPQRAERAMRTERAEAFFLCLIARCRSLRIAPRKPPTLSSLADEKRVGSLLRNTARRWGWCSLRSRRLFGHGGARSGASDDDDGGLQARCASSSKKKQPQSSTWRSRRASRAGCTRSGVVSGIEA
jgi:hypothetical protein